MNTTQKHAQDLAGRFGTRRTLSVVKSVRSRRGSTIANDRDEERYHHAVTLNTYLNQLGCVLIVHFNREVYP